MGPSQLLSVPYAMMAENSCNNVNSPFMFNEDTVYLMMNVGIGTDSPIDAMLSVVGDDPLLDNVLFEVRRQDGQPVFTEILTQIY